MFEAFVLVRNLQSTAASLDFGEFTIKPVGTRFTAFREVFSSTDVNQDDWIFEKPYEDLPAGPPGSAVGGIPNDIEEALLLLRLFKPGDISFVKLAIVLPNGNTQVQSLYRAMNELNSYSPNKFQVAPDECAVWKDFADDIRRGQSWGSAWFAAATGFFLSGGAKQWNPRLDDADRILDYAAALEATLVGDRDFLKRRLANRAARLIAPDDPKLQGDVLALMGKFYDVRSVIAHGNELGDEDRNWLNANDEEIELRVRQVLRTSVQTLPPEKIARRMSLARVYDPTDEDRGDFAFGKFQEIKTTPVRRDIAEKIMKLVENQKPPA
jgi:hypothetical protein